jgi:hypothetical protein
VRIAWGCGAPLGFVGRADGRPDPIAWTRQNAVELSAQTWRVLDVGESVEPGGALELGVDGARVFRGQVSARTGPLGLFLEHWSHVRVDRFKVTGAPRWSAAELADLLKAFRARKGVPISNLEIYQKGTVSPSSVAVFREAGAR